jgi:hypothetical protein
MITIFGDLDQFSAKKLRFSSKTMPWSIFGTLWRYFEPNRHFMRFIRRTLKNHNIDPPLLVQRAFFFGVLSTCFVMSVYQPPTAGQSTFKNFWHVFTHCSCNFNGHDNVLFFRKIEVNFSTSVRSLTFLHSLASFLAYSNVIATMRPVQCREKSST